MIFGAIAAGGIGKRMGIPDLPKQFLMLGSKPIIIHTLEKFIVCDRIDHIYVGIHKDWMLYMENLINKYNLDVSKIKIVEGGQCRNHTVQNIINSIENDYGENADNIIVTHDAVRPFVTLRIISESIDAAIECGASDTVIPSNDTVICSNDRIKIFNIPKRDNMFLGQTPQTFNMSKLKMSYLGLTDSEMANFTDACSVFVSKNYPVKLVFGESENLKITTLSDYKIACAIISQNFGMDQFSDNAQKER